MWACFIVYLTDEDSKKLDIIKKAVLMSEGQSREKRKERVKKYLTWVRVNIQVDLFKYIYSTSLAKRDQ